MITEWQPIMPGDKLKLKARTIYEFLRTDATIFLGVGLGPEQEAAVTDDVVAYREFETKPLASPSKSK